MHRDAREKKPHHRTIDSDRPEQHSSHVVLYSRLIGGVGVVCFDSDMGAGRLMCVDRNGSDLPGPLNQWGHGLVAAMNHATTGFTHVTCLWIWYWLWCVVLHALHMTSSRSIIVASSFESDLKFN